MTPLPTRGRPRKDAQGPRRKTSLVMGEALLQRLKIAAVEERTDVSTLLSRLAEAYLGKRRPGGGR